MRQARTADDLLTLVAATAPQDRAPLLEGYGVTILRAAADLCLADSTGMSKKAAITAITGNF